MTIGCPTTGWSGRAASRAAQPERWADQSESATTMTTEAVIVGRGGGLLTWDGRL